MVKRNLITMLAGALVTQRRSAPALAPINENRGGWFRIFESYTGAWQHGVVVDHNTVLTFHAIYSCMTLIASDIAKLRVKLTAVDDDGVWTEQENSAYSPVLRKPNRYQNRIQFWENWILSKLSRGNTYALKQRGDGGKVRALYILDPNLVTPLVAPDGSIFYQLRTDNLTGLAREITVPASEIIHDRFNCLFHPLIGTTPIVACGIAAMQGLAIQNSQTWFFNNRATPAGFLTAPGAISNETAARLQTGWETNYGGENAGKVAVLGDGLEFKAMTVAAADAQIIEQLKWTAQVACACFHVPGYKIGIAEPPRGESVQSINLEYYAQALQRLIEDAELCIDEGLGMDTKTGSEFDIDNLLRMDSAAQMDVLQKGSGILKINEQRKALNKPPLKQGGDTVYLQEQNYSVEALAKRDAMDNPFGSKSTPTPVAQPTPPALPPPAKRLDPAAIAKALEIELAA